jgi:hypothetical protein
MKGFCENGLKGHGKVAQGIADEQQEPKATAGRNALGRLSVFIEVFSSYWRGRTPHANTRRIVADSLTQGVARKKSLALPWAIFLRPLRGLEVFSSAVARQSGAW